MRKLFAPAVALLFASALHAELELPQPSPAATVTQRIGTSTVTVAYHRPGVKGREVWGKLVPFGEVWRMGANDATTLELSHDAKVAGKALPAGKYALFAVPAREKWQIVVNSQADQWGAYFRDAKKDVLSFDVTPVAGPEEEWLEFRIEPASKNALRVEMAWEKLRVAFPVEFDVTGIVWKNIDAAIAAADPKDYKTLYQAAKYAFQSGERKEKAAGWLDEAMKRGQSFWMDELKGDLLAEAGKYREAIPYVEKAIEGSKKAGAPDAWRDGARKKIDGWREKMKDGMKG
jgi:tetratricopeptide (TPR) repeat protein